MVNGLGSYFKLAYSTKRLSKLPLASRLALPWLE